MFLDWKMDKQIWYTLIYHGILFSDKEVLPTQAITWTGLNYFKLSERKQTEEAIMISLIWHSGKGQIIGIDNTSLLARSYAWGMGWPQRGTSEKSSVMMNCYIFDCDGRYTTAVISKNSNFIICKLKMWIKSTIKHTIDINNKRTKKQDQNVCSFQEMHLNKKSLESKKMVKDTMGKY